MTRHKDSSTVLAILLVLLSTAASDVSRAQRANGAAKLVVSVTVPPICTVAVTPGQRSPMEAIAVRCRNLGSAHPQPVVTEARPVNDPATIIGNEPEVFETEWAAGDPLAPAPPADPIDEAGSLDPVAMVVINF